MRPAGIIYSPEASLGIVISLIVIMPIVYWRLRVSKRKRRASFIEQFSPQELRANRYNTTVVYRIIDQKDHRLRIQAIWSDGNPVHGGKHYFVKEADVILFDLDAFLSGW